MSVILASYEFIEAGPKSSQYSVASGARLGAL
jgi:hypothetical protein